MFRLVSTWVVPADPQRVWEALVAVERWPDWWPGISSATVVRRSEAGDPVRVVFVVRSPLGYRLRFGVEIVRAVAPVEADARVVGDLVGSGRWSVTPTATGCVATINWDVRPVRWPLQAMTGVLARPLAWAHAVVMRAGEAALQKHVARN